MGAVSDEAEHRRRASLLRRQAADRFRPEHVRLLLVAHAPPNGLERYFYFEDVPAKDDLFRYVAKALFGNFPERADKPKWLNGLRDAGVFLIDLLEEPFDGGDLAPHVPNLIQRARRLRPDHVVLIKADVFDAAYKRLVDAGLPVVNVRIPFPGSGQQRRFEAAIASALSEAGWTS